MFIFVYRQFLVYYQNYYLNIDLSKREDKVEFEKLSEEIFVCVSKEHKFGTDAFLLADFASPKHKHNVCDLGTGCGIIPFVLEKRFQPKSITGVDIQQQAITQFSKGIEKSNLQDKLVPLLGDLKNIKDLLQGSSFDIVTMNPPYKLNGTGVLNESNAHTIARHETLCTLKDICNAASYLLNFGGSFFVCQRPERLIDTIENMKQAGLEPKRLRFVAKDKNSAPWLFLLEGRKGGNPYLKVEPLLCIYKENSEEYNEEIKKIYGE